MPPKKLSGGDKEFIKLIEEGTKKSPAFRMAYPEHPAVIQWNRSEPGSPARQEAMETIIDAAKTKLQAQYMRGAIATYHDSMEKYSQLSIETAIDLVKNARSEKVRADLAIEGIRHKIGTPVQKVAIQERKTVILQFGAPPDLIEGELARDEIPRDLDDTDYT